MRVRESLKPCSGETAVALGCFDGVHQGHRAVICGAVKQKENGLTPVVFTFAESPLKELTGVSKPRIMTNALKIEMLEKLGVGLVYTIPFSAVMNLSAGEFVRDILDGVLHAKKVTCGYNYHFGFGGTADSGTLKGLCARFGIEVCSFAPVTEAGEPVSSSRVRKLLERGDVTGANRLLGHAFAYDFEVVHGRHIGHLMGTPTLNQVFPEDFVIPRYGVYASKVSFDGTTTYGVTNVGVKPTVGAEENPLSETWMPEYAGDELYGKNVKTELLGFIRPEKKFSGLEELRAEIHRNAEQARRIAQPE